MKITTVLSTAALTVVCAGSLAACGSSEPAASSSDVQPALKTVSKAEFVKQGNALCKANVNAIGSKFAAMSEPPTKAQLNDAFETLLSESYKLTGDMLAIGAPKGQEKELVDLLVEAQKVNEKVQARGQDAFFADQQADPYGATAEKFVKDFGLTECAPQN